MAEDITEGSGLELLRPPPGVSDDASVSYRAKQIRALFAEIDDLCETSNANLASMLREWARAESAEASLAQVTKERDEARRYCSAAYHDCTILLHVLTSSENAHLFPKTIADLKQTSEFMKLAAEGKADGTIYEDELTEARDRAERLLDLLREARDSIEAWGAYAAPYFQEKHDLAGELARIDAAINPKDPA